MYEIFQQSIPFLICAMVVFIIAQLLTFPRRRHCTVLNDSEILHYCNEHNMIEPFLQKKVKQGHLSGGLGHFGYDIHISGKVKVIKKHQRPVEPTNPDEDLTAIRYIEHDLDGFVIKPGEFVLAFTKERFDIPPHIVALVKDKSTLARLAIAVQNTVLEPGWSGYLTIELSNHGPLEIVLREGMPIAQMLFFRGNTPDTIYEGRYNDQAHGTPAINNTNLT